MTLGTITLELTVVAVLLSGACGRQDARLQQHQESFESLAATTHGVADAWLSGDVSGTYTLAALERVFQLTEQERTALAASPRSLQDPRGAELSQRAERLSRLVASMMGDVRAADGDAVRHRLQTLPIVPPKVP